jgi:hypothetical protein
MIWAIAPRGQQPNPHIPAAVTVPVAITVADENGRPVPGAQVTILEPSLPAAQLRTDCLGSCSYLLRQQSPFQIHVEKAGFYAADEKGIDARLKSLKVTLAHEQIVSEQVSVAASTPGIDAQ